MGLTRSSIFPFGDILSLLVEVVEANDLSFVILIFYRRISEVDDVNDAGRGYCFY